MTDGCRHLACFVRVAYQMVHPSTPQAEAFAKQLKSQGYCLVGPTSVYAFIQNVGIVNDHVRGCFRAIDYRTTAGSR